MSLEAAELEMVQRHVREGEYHLANQRALIARLKVSGLPTEEAEVLLRIFEDAQGQHNVHLARIKAALLAAGT